MTRINFLEKRYDLMSAVIENTQYENMSQFWVHQKIRNSGEYMDIVRGGLTSETRSKPMSIPSTRGLRPF